MCAGPYARRVRRRDPLADPKQLSQKVYAYVAYRIGAGPDAEDVTSETFERALRYRSGYDRSRGTPTAWMIGIARRVLADRALSGAHELPVADLPEVAERGELEGDLVVRLSVQGAMAMLPERDRELLALRYGADLTAAQIAGEMEMKVNAVEVALHRAIGRLRQAMDGDAVIRLSEDERVDIAG